MVTERCPKHPSTLVLIGPDDRMILLGIEAVRGGEDLAIWPRAFDHIQFAVGRLPGTWKRFHDWVIAGPIYNVQLASSFFMPSRRDTQ